MRSLVVGVGRTAAQSKLILGSGCSSSINAARQGPSPDDLAFNSAELRGSRRTSITHVYELVSIT